MVFVAGTSLFVNWEGAGATLQNVSRVPLKKTER